MHTPEKKQKPKPKKPQVTCDTDVSATSFGQWRVERAHKRRGEEWVSQTITGDSPAWDDTARMDTSAGGCAPRTHANRQSYFGRGTFGGILQNLHPFPGDPMTASCFTLVLIFTNSPLLRPGRRSSCPRSHQPSPINWS